MEQIILPSQEIQRLLEKFDKTMKAYVTLLMETGVRVEDVSKLKVGDIKNGIL